MEGDAIMFDPNRTVAGLGEAHWILQKISENMGTSLTHIIFISANLKLWKMEGLCTVVDTVEFEILKNEIVKCLNAGNLVIRQFEDWLIGIWEIENFELL